MNNPNEQIVEGLINGIRGFLYSLPDQNAPISATVDFVVEPESESEFILYVNQLVDETRKQPGLNWFSADKVQPTDPDDDKLRYVIMEHWESVTHFATHQWGSPHLRAFQLKVFDWVSEQPQIKWLYGTLSETSVFPINPPKKKRFIDNDDGTVTDSTTGLTWFQDANAFGEMPWEQATHAMREIDSRVPGYRINDESSAGDWRLPNINELQSLLDLTISKGAAIRDGVFKNLEAANYWSSTSVAAFPALAWYTAMALGPPVFDMKINGMRIWPVRGESSKIRSTGQNKAWNSWGIEIPVANSGQDAEFQSSGMPIPGARFRVNTTKESTPQRPISNGTVTDLVTGLTWLQNGNPFGLLSWDDAAKACDKLSADKFEFLNDGSKSGDWKLPDVNELRSLGDYSRARPCLADGHPFTNIDNGLVWTSTTLASAPTLARFSYVGIGSCVWDHKSVLMGVWPVKKV